jgi:hypothetical protein
LLSVTNKPIKLSVIILNVVMQSVVAPTKEHFYVLFVVPPKMTKASTIETVACIDVYGLLVFANVNTALVAAAKILAVNLGCLGSPPALLQFSSVCY